VQKRRLKRKKIPEYRRIKNYYKSTAQYWKERNRRQQVLKLTNEGYTLQQIAKEIGCSYRTVRRDAVKLERYIKGQFNCHMQQLQREATEKLNRELEGLSIKDMGKRFQVLTRLMFRTRKLSKREIEKQHNGIVFLDFDRLELDGFPDLRLGNPNGQFKTPYTFSFIAVKNGKPHHLGAIKIK
jgi:DNA-binding CsgD family transcriptional regulator